MEQCGGGGEVGNGVEECDSDEISLEKKKKKKTWKIVKKKRMKDEDIW